MGTIYEYPLDKDIEEHKWKIKILKSENKNIQIGVAPIDFDINSSYIAGKQGYGWYFSCDDKKFYSGPPHNYNEKPSKIKEIEEEIIAIMNMKKRTLKFLGNPQDEGDLISNIPLDKTLVPAIFLFNKDDSVQIIDY